ncbi:cytochrome P450 [Paenactinomyces guangxiensis]|uniref:Cytochrome P450 n=1 Tax=Paenactinomyces guangxiensis TaxID=1490290 RepID=A0A7W2AA77_9BACL|nr:cytochrome P450 [Paenactinomyces guangxiensis]MBA4496505.1 cytochrome P450 [Paenactinomyces guangxiensis]MBH8593640.1 cytochrome P450 [Paenactinomyces guangxiensis]
MPESTDKVWEINLFSSEFKENAYQIYKQLRLNDPVHRITMPSGHHGWLITRYQDALAVLKDDRIIKNPRKVLNTDKPNRVLAESDLLTNHMLSSDPPDHTRLRSLVQKAFTPRMVEGLRGRIEEIAHTLLNDVQDKGKMNVIDDFAFPLPIIVICEMLGIPAEDRDKFREWSNAIISATNQPDKMRQIQPQVQEFIDYLHDLITKRRQTPRDDLVSRLVHAESEGDQLTEKELFAMIFLLIIAGHETTVNLIGNGILALLEHPAQMEKLKQQPELIHSAVEEMLRYYSPVEIATNRWASEDIFLGGKKIPKGDMVLVMLGSANRDPEQFANPDQLDITRENNRHIAFGLGIHYCLGAPLARLEGEIAIQTLLARMPDIQLAVNPATLKWRPTFLMRGLEELPVTF